MSSFTPPLSCLARVGPALVAAALAATLAGCSIMLPEGKGRPNSREADQSVPPPPSLTAPGRADVDRGEPITEAQTYRGVIPCADCAGQRVTLTLMPDWTYRLRRVYTGTRDGRDATFVSTGRWMRGIDNPHRVNLIGDRNESGVYEFAPGGSNVLRLVEQDDRPVNSALNYSLTKQFEADPIGDSFTMRGQVSRGTAGLVYGICGTGKKYPVAAEGAARELGDAYGKLRLAPNTPALMWIKGHIATRGEPAHEEVVVEGLTGGTLDSPCE